MAQFEVFEGEAQALGSSVERTRPALSLVDSGPEKAALRRGLFLRLEAPWVSAVYEAIESWGWEESQAFVRAFLTDLAEDLDDAAMIDEATERRRLIQKARMAHCLQGEGYPDPVAFDRSQDWWPLLSDAMDIYTEYTLQELGDILEQATWELYWAGMVLTLEIIQAKFFENLEKDARARNASPRSLPPRERPPSSHLRLVDPLE